MTHGQAPILLVEDNPDTGDVLEEVLVAAGFSVLAARSGAEALALLAVGRMPCLVLLDFVLPDMDGHRLLERLRAEPGLRDVPVVAISASPVAHPALTGTLRKPFGLEELLGVVRRHVG